MATDVLKLLELLSHPEHTMGLAKVIEGALPKIIFQRWTGSEIRAGIDSTFQAITKAHIREVGGRTTFEFAFLDHLGNGHHIVASRALTSGERATIVLDGVTTSGVGRSITYKTHFASLSQQFNIRLTPGLAYRFDGYLDPAHL